MTHVTGTGSRGQRFAERHAHRIRNLARQLPEKFAAGKAEDRSPNAVPIDGDDQNIYAFHDAFKSTAKRKHLADARHLTFGENTDELAVAQSFGGLTQGMNHFARSLIRCDGNHAEDFGEWLYEWMIVD